MSETTSPHKRPDAQTTASSLELAHAAAQVSEDNRAKNIVVLDMRKLTSAFDYFVIVTGASRRQLHAISDEIDNKFEKELGDTRLGREGYDDSRWILLDYGDVVIHIFDDVTRDYFSLEELWAEAPRVDLSQVLHDHAANEASKSAPLSSENQF